jgi:glycosyltransferase involved in cell wall biosynthesis
VPERPHLLHVTPSFAPGGAQVRTTQIMNHLGSGFRHTVIALDGDLSAKERIHSSVCVEYVACWRSGNPVVMAHRLARVMREQQPHLVLTYNWGSVDGVVAAQLSGPVPVIHAEDGFGDDEAETQKRRRVLFRRYVLPRTYRIVTPSRTLVNIIRRVWKLPEHRVEHIPNGVPVDRFGPAARPPGQCEIVIGTVGHLRKEKGQDALIEAAAALARRHPVQLLIVGDGPERRALEKKARLLGFSDRVVFLGHAPDPASAYQQMDLFALPSKTEQMPLAVLEAMASGLAIAGTDVGDVKEMVSAANRPFIASTRQGFEEALEHLATNRDLRLRVGAANRARCAELYDVRRMLDRYAALYEAALRS